MLEEGIKQFFIRIIDSVQRGFNLALRALDILPLHMLGIQCRVGINQLLCCRKIVAHQPVEIRSALRAFLHLIKDPCHDLLKSVELRRNLLSRNLLVLLMDMCNEGLPLVQNLLRLRIELSSVFLLRLLLRLQLPIFRQRLSAQLRSIRPAL